MKSLFTSSSSANVKHCFRLFLDVTLALIVVSVGCSRQTCHINLVIPKDFRGPITISADASSDFGPNKSCNGTTIVYHIPPSGRLVTKDITPFFNFAHIQAEYAGGEKVPSEGAAKDESALRNLPGDNFTVNFLIGTEEEMNRMWADPFSWQPKKSNK